MKLLRLTALQKDLTVEAVEKIRQYKDSEDEDDIVDSNGKTREYYENIGIPVSPEILDREKNIKSLDLDEDTDYEWTAAEAIVDLKQFKFAVDVEEDPDDGSVVYLKEGLSIQVAESSEEIYGQITYLNRSLWEKFQGWIRVQKLQIKRLLK